MHDVSGVTGAAPMWNEAMRTLLRGRPDQPFARPAGLEEATVCELSGLLPTEACPHTRSEWFIARTQPTQTDTYYQAVTLDVLTGALADERTPSERRQPAVVLDLPLEAQPWARQQGLPLLADVRQRTDLVETNSLVMLSPTPNTTYRITSETDLSAQQLSVEAIAGRSFSALTIYVDGAPLQAFSAPPYQAWWPLAPGTHRFWAEGLSPGGETVTSEPVVITVVQ
jgi:membrane carboxypeptidase/penicillin-binding protein PbpC